MKKYIEYCTGCGLCELVSDVNLEEDKKGFRRPNALSKMQLSFCDKVCMNSGKFWERNKGIHTWGNIVHKPIFAYSSDNNIRLKASSGGVLTSCAVYLLNKHLVDGILQTKVDPDNPIKTILVCSKTEDEVIQCCGSRYTISSPFKDFKEVLNSEKTYAFIGKPCDVMALRNYSFIEPIVNDVIKYYLSFFCAGMPSYEAGRNLLQRLHSSCEACSELTYRGSGWPGFATAVDRNGSSGSISYNDSWGKILGRDINKCCRFCLDGIGEAADISCGDGWYVKDGKPDFSEHDGRNVVFGRTDIGESLMRDMIRDGVIKEDGYCSFDQLIQIQNYQYIRRCTMIDKMNALKLMRRPVPDYNRKYLSNLEEKIPVSTRLKIFTGICKRIHDDKI
ncbi:MAG: Coenzyme F420 hydrogenase/dehydrogenase, beta subunit C-terminal domain [Lachnospiraceae bacterium]